MKWHKVFRLTALVLVVYGLLAGVAGILVCEGALHPSRRPLSESDRQLAQALANRHTSRLQDVDLLATDGVVLRAWLLIPQTPNRTAVILLHGVSDNRMGMMGYAELLLKHGYTILMPDARAHGASGGPVATYGLLERKDLRDWFQLLQRTTHPACIDGFGESMGAAQLLQALTVEPDFCSVGAESSFASLREIGYDRVGQFFHTGSWIGRTIFRPVIDVAFWWGKQKYHLDLEQASPQSAVANSQPPVLLIHGTADDNIPYRHARLTASHAPHLVLWTVPGANHCGAITTAHDFDVRLIQWFTDHDKRSLAVAAID